MNLKNTLSYLALFLLSTAQANEISIESKSDASLKGLSSNQTQELKANENKKFSITEPTLVRSTGKIPAIILPAGSENSQVKLDLPDANEVMIESSSEKLGQNLSLLMVGISEVESSLKKRDLKEAKVRYQRLSEKFPNVDFLEFTQASITLLEGNRVEALKIAEHALQKYPHYTDGKTFVENLQGKKQ